MNHRFSHHAQRPLRVVFLLCLLGVGVFAWAQGRHFRRHTVIEKRPLTVVPADQPPPDNSEHTFEAVHGHRHVVSNGIPNHDVGQFPNRGNPHSIRTQRYQFSLPLDPKPADQITPLHQTERLGPPNRPFGIAVNGILFDPGTAEFWNGDRRQGVSWHANQSALANLAILIDRRILGDRVCQSLQRAHQLFGVKTP